MLSPLATSLVWSHHVLIHYCKLVYEDNVVDLSIWRLCKATRPIHGTCLCSFPESKSNLVVVSLILLHLYAYTAKLHSETSSNWILRKISTDLFFSNIPECWEKQRVTRVLYLAVAFAVKRGSLSVQRGCRQLTLMCDVFMLAFTNAHLPKHTWHNKARTHSFLHFDFTSAFITFPWPLSRNIEKQVHANLEMSDHWPVRLFHGGKNYLTQEMLCWCDLRKWWQCETEQLPTLFI